MDTVFIGLGILGAFVIGLVAGGIGITVFRGALLGRRQRIAERKAARIEAEARSIAKNIVDEAKTEADKVKNTAENEYRQRRGDLQRQENRLTQKIDSLDHKLENLDSRERNLNNREKEIENQRAAINEIRGSQLKKLEEISQLSTADAKKLLLENMEAEMKEETGRRIRDWQATLQQQVNEKSQEILVQAIQRQASEIVYTATHPPSME